MNISDLNPYKHLLTLALCMGVVIAGNVWFNGKLDTAREDGKDQVRAEYQKAFSAAKAASDLRETELTAQRDEALKNANEREQTIRTLAGSNGLRDTLSTIRGGLPSASEEALRHTAFTLTSVFGDCQERYRSLAERADRHASDTKTLDEAFPQNATPAKPREPH